MKLNNNNINIQNKKASHDYEFLEKFTAGMVLTGTEIKSIRLGKASLVDSYCRFTGDELYITGLNISEYFFGTYNNHAPVRDRKLLLLKRELRRLKRKTADKGLTIVATRIFISESGYAKVNIALCRGKREYDKRESLKKKDNAVELARIKRERY